MKAKQKKFEKNREKHEISHNKHRKKVNAWAGISNSEKLKNKYSSFYWEYDQRVICKHYVEIFERNGNKDRKSFELIWDNNLKHTSNLAIEFYKKKFLKNRLTCL